MPTATDDLPRASIRSRLAHAAATILTIALGLASRRVAPHLPAPVGPFVAAYVGDVLWAAMVLFGLSTLLPRLALRRRIALALAYCIATELSQLYHAPWIDAVRATRLGGLVLGFGFLWSDLVAYTVGVLGAAALARLGEPRFATAHPG
jgi:hypothetical protein